MKKLLIFILVTVPFGAIAQHFIAAKFGLLNSSVKSITFKSVKPVIKNNYGVLYEYKTKSKFTFGAEFLIENRGFDDAPAILNATSRYDYSYVSIPVKIGYDYGKQIQLSGRIGVNYASILKATSTQKASNSEFDIEPFSKKNDLGLFVEIGTSIQASKSIKLQVMSRYLHSTSNNIAQTTPYPPSNSYHKNIGISIALGIQIP
jgi:hypothetical protein